MRPAQRFRRRIAGTLDAVIRGPRQTLSVHSGSHRGAMLRRLNEPRFVSDGRSAASHDASSAEGAAALIPGFARFSPGGSPALTPSATVKLGR